MFGIPGVLLTGNIKNKKVINRIVIAALLGSIILATIIDYLGFLNHSWFVIDTIFPFRIMNMIPLEDPIWALLWVYLILATYESRFKTGNKSLLGKRAKYWFLLNGFAFLALVTTFLINPMLLQTIPYYYLISGTILALIPTILFLKFYPKYISSFLKVASYISLVSFLDEIVALKLNHWTFYGGKFLMLIKIWGVNLPFEELFFFILIGPVFVLCYYEFLDGDTT